jgi:hypothetical protein
MKHLKRSLIALLALAVTLCASQPIQLTAILNLTETGITTGLSVSGLYVPLTGSKYSQFVMAVPTTSGGTSIPLSSLANIGYCEFVNLDPTNYVDVLTAVTGSSGVAFARLMPGDAHLFRFTPAVTAPAMLAHTASVNVQLLCIEN